MTLNAWLRTLGDGLLDLVFAPVCVACDRAIPTVDGARLICRVCWARARPLPAPHCPRCWEPLRQPRDPATACPLCPQLPPGVRCVRSAFAMLPPVSDMVHALKYRGWEAAAEPMGARLCEVPWPADVRDEARLVVPVPVSPSRRRQRGYNQAELLATAYAERAGRTCEPELLLRVRATETQTALHPDERRANVAHAFAVAAGRAPQLHREHLLLIDDVWTTGATALACAEALLGEGARAVSVLTFARALRDRSHTPVDAPGST
jgi:ComF family protein